MLIVRRAEPRDEPAWTRVWDASARAGFADLLPADHPFPEIDLDLWHALLAGSAVTLLLAEDEGELLGLTACGESRDPDAGATAGEVRAFFVAPGQWRPADVGTYHGDPLPAPARVAWAGCESTTSMRSSRS